MGDDSCLVCSIEGTPEAPGSPGTAAASRSFRRSFYGALTFAYRFQHISGQLLVNDSDRLLQLRHLLAQRDHVDQGSVCLPLVNLALPARMGQFSTRCARSELAVDLFHPLA